LFEDMEKERVATRYLLVQGVDRAFKEQDLNENFMVSSALILARKLELHQQSVSSPQTVPFEGSQSQRLLHLSHQHRRIGRSRFPRRSRLAHCCSRSHEEHAVWRPLQCSLHYEEYFRTGMVVSLSSSVFSFR
jgi:hypothetical protein